jgi:hypothetical protein
MAEAPLSSAELARPGLDAGKVQLAPHQDKNDKCGPGRRHALAPG